MKYFVPVISVMWVIGFLFAFGYGVNAAKTRSAIEKAWCSAEHGGEMQDNVCVVDGRAYDVPDWISGEGE